MTTHLGHAIGILLDDEPRHGTASVRIETAGRTPTEWAVEFTKPGTWSADNGTERWVCDRETLAVTSRGGIREERPIRHGWVHKALQPFFAAAAPIWGRRGDDWRLLEGPRLEEGMLIVGVESLKPPGHSGRLIIHPEEGFIAAMLLPGHEVTVTEFDSRPPDPAGSRR